MSKGLTTVAETPLVFACSEHALMDASRSYKLERLTGPVQYRFKLGTRWLGTRSLEA